MDLAPWLPKAARASLMDKAGSTSRAAHEQCGCEQRREGGRLGHCRSQRRPVCCARFGSRRRETEVRGEAVEVLQVHGAVVVEVALIPRAVRLPEVGGEAVEVLQVDRA